MKDFRLVLVSTEPKSDYWFVIFQHAINEHEVVKFANRIYAPHFEVVRDKVTETIQ